MTEGFITGSGDSLSVVLAVGLTLYGLAYWALVLRRGVLKSAPRSSLADTT